jgi:hypothetical protein
MAGDRRLIGKHVVEREIGRGEMGAVYLARNNLDRNIAIKNCRTLSIAALSSGGPPDGSDQPIPTSFGSTT